MSRFFIRWCLMVALPLTIVSCAPGKIEKKIEPPGPQPSKACAMVAEPKFRQSAAALAKAFDFTTNGSLIAVAALAAAGELPAECLDRAENQVTKDQKAGRHD